MCSNVCKFLSQEGNTCVAFNSSSRYLLTGGKSKTLGIWDMKTKGLKKTYRVGKEPFMSCRKHLFDLDLD